MIEDILRFSQLLEQFRAVKRTVRAGSEERFENDTEHSYMLAMLAWYIIETKKLNLDSAKAMRYALVHDVVEVYAGDTAFFSRDQTLHNTKDERERVAVERLKKEFPEFSILHETIEGYERKKDKEAIFVTALDKLQPVIAIYLDKGRTWREYDISRTEVIEKKSEKIKMSPEVDEIWQTLIPYLHEEGIFEK